MKVKVVAAHRDDRCLAPAVLTAGIELCRGAPAVHHQMGVFRCVQRRVLHRLHRRGPEGPDVFQDDRLVRRQETGDLLEVQFTLALPAFRGLLRVQQAGKVLPRAEEERGGHDHGRTDNQQDAGLLFPPSPLLVHEPVASRTISPFFSGVLLLVIT